MTYLLKSLFDTTRSFLSLNFYLFVEFIRYHSSPLVRLAKHLERYANQSFLHLLIMSSSHQQTHKVRIMNTSTQHLIIGATGKTGSRVMKGLKALGYHPKGASRHGEVAFDWSEPTTWSPALNGVDAIYLTYFPDLAVPQAPDDISKFCALAKMKGVKHITVLSGRSEPAAQTCENIIKQSGLYWTVVRASWFNQNFSEGLFRQFIMDGNIALPVSNVTEPFIDIDDIAEVVVASLTDEKHHGQLYEVTGPELISFATIAEKFTHHLNRKIHFESISIPEFQSRLAQANVHQEVIGMLTYLFGEVLDGRSEFCTDGVERALGRPATTFDQYIQNNLQYFTEKVEA